MPLIASTLEADLNQLDDDFERDANINEDPKAARRRYNKRFAEIVDAYIKTGTVKVTVATTGTAAAQTGTGTGNIT